MRVMVMIKATEDSEAGAPPTEAALAEMNRFNDELLRAGVLLAGDGLKPSRFGKQVKSMEEAMEWLRRFPDPGHDAVVELRPLYDMETDGFGSAVTPEDLARIAAEKKQRA